MGAHTSTTGGGAATGTANAFQGFLQQMMGQGNGQPQMTLPNGGVKPAGMPDQLWSHIQQQQSNAQQPQQQVGANTGGQFGTLVNQMASGQVNDQSGAGGLLGQYMNNQPQSPSYTNPYQSQTFQGFNPSQLPTNYGGSGMADLSGYGNIGPTNQNVTQGMGQLGQSSFTNQLQNLMGQGQGMLGGGAQNVGAQNVQLGNARQVDLNSPEIQAQQQIADRQRMLAIADQRARFGAEGAGSLGTGAQYAEGTLNAEFGPRMAAQLQQSIQQQQQADLQERQARAGVGLGTAGNMLQAGIANQNAGLQAGAQNQNLFSNLLGAASTGRAQDFSNQSQNRGMDISQMGLGLNQAQGNQGAALTQQGQMLQSMLQNQGMGNQFGLANNAQNSSNMQNNNMNGMNQAQQQNQFNLNNAGQSAQYGMGTNQLNSNNFNQGQSNFLQSLGMGLNQNNVGNQNMQNLLQQLFGANMQATGIGTPQAQTIQTPSAASQIFGALAPIATGLLMPGMGGMGGGQQQTNPQAQQFAMQQQLMSQFPQLPAFNVPQQNTTWGQGPVGQYTGGVQMPWNPISQQGNW